LPRGHSRSNLSERLAEQAQERQVAPWVTRVVQRLTCPIFRATGDHKKRGEERNGFFCDMALGDASWYAAPVDHHSGSTVGKYPASSWPQPTLDNSRVCAAGKSDRLMGICVHPMAEPRHNSCPLVAAPLKSQRPCPCHLETKGDPPTGAVCRKPGSLTPR
jgi:hypothetical protein